MRFIKILFWGIVGLALIVLALANRQIVSLQLLPTELANVIGINNAIQLPLFLVILMGVLIGLMIGFVWEYLREYKHRREAKVKNREVRKLNREVEKLKEQSGESKDDILALIE